MRYGLAALIAAAATAFPEAALADLRPDPTDPTGAYSPIYLVLLVVIGVGIYLYRRRK